MSASDKLAKANLFFVSPFAGRKGIRGSLSLTCVKTWFLYFISLHYFPSGRTKTLLLSDCVCIFAFILAPLRRSRSGLHLFTVSKKNSVYVFSRTDAPEQCTSSRGRFHRCALRTLSTRGHVSAMLGSEVAAAGGHHHHIRWQRAQRRTQSGNGQTHTHTHKNHRTHAFPTSPRSCFSCPFYMLPDTPRDRVSLLFVC